MDLKEAMACRHSVRRYTDRPLTAEATAALRANDRRTNARTGLHIRLRDGRAAGIHGTVELRQAEGVRNWHRDGGAGRRRSSTC